MATTVSIDGISHSIEKLATGVIRVSHPVPQLNPMHGPATGGECWYDVHPCQRHQYEFWNAQLPVQEQAIPEGMAEARPWWSLPAGERANLRE